MTPFVVTAVLSLLALDAAPSSSQPNTVSQVQVTSPSKTAANGVDDPDKVICHKEAITGSRFEKRVCMTKSQWDDRERQVEVLERRLNQTATPQGGGGFNGN
jgi:hypothetical protein